MSFVKRCGMDFYVCHSYSHITKASERDMRNWWLIKDNNGCGVIRLNTITFPKEFIGKKIRIKIEIIEDEK